LHQNVGYGTVVREVFVSSLVVAAIARTFVFVT